MSNIKIKNGLRLPISGEPSQQITNGNEVKHAALLGSDYVGMKPKFEVCVGDKVKLGQLLFIDKKCPKIHFTSPGSGKITAIHRGEKRRFLSIIVELDGQKQVTFKSYSEEKFQSLKRDQIVSQLLESGMWTALRARPFGRAADPDTTPHSIFITAMDTNPLAPSVPKILEGRERSFRSGLKILSKLTEGSLFLCKAPGDDIPEADIPKLVVEEFAGPHPTGNPGTHIHFLDPVNQHKIVWHIGFQDVTAIGNLFMIGELDVERIISITGPDVKNPRLLKTRIGASISELTGNECKPGMRRIISGSVFNGHTAEEKLNFLGRYHQQITVMPETKTRTLFGWLSPGFKLFSVKNIVASKLFPWTKFDFTTLQHGGKRAILPVGSYEKVMPLDILPTYLLRALAVNDIDESEKLGCLELVEEDLALCTFVCPSKINHGENLRRVLNLIEKEG